MRRGLFRVVVIAGLLGVASSVGTAPRAEEERESEEAVALKGRTAAPKDAELDTKVTIPGLIAKHGPKDWSTAKGVALDGYLIQVEKDPDGDVHLVVAAKAGESNTKNWVIAEVTPHWQGQSPDLSEASLRKLHGKNVRVTGWLFYDSDPVPDPRGTFWEIHPVTGVKRLETP